MLPYNCSVLYIVCIKGMFSWMLGLSIIEFSLLTTILCVVSDGKYSDDGDSGGCSIP